MFYPELKVQEICGVLNSAGHSKMKGCLFSSFSRLLVAWSEETLRMRSIDIIQSKEHLAKSLIGIMAQYSLESIQIKESALFECLAPVKIVLPGKQLANIKASSQYPLELHVMGIFSHFEVPFFLSLFCCILVCCEGCFLLWFY